MKTQILLLAAAISLFGCLSQQTPAFSYYEFIRDSPNATNGPTFAEYIVFSTGLVLEKQEYGSDATKTVMTTYHANKQDAIALLNLAKTLPPASEKWACEDCDSYQLFLLDGEQTQKAFFNTSSAPQAVKDLQAKTISLIQTPDRDAFFIKFVQQKIKGNIVDYHITGDGLVLNEEFGTGPGEILSSRIYAIDKTKVGFIMNNTHVESFTDQGLKNCVENGLVYGYVEAVKDGKYGFSYTCGGDSPEGKLFDLIKNQDGVLN